VPAKHEYTGIDIEPELFPTEGDGIRFEKYSFQEPFPSEWLGSFDLVHQRLGLAGSSPKPVIDVVRNLASLVKPGGYLQLVELNIFGPPKTGPAVLEVCRLMKDIFTAIGVGDYAQHMTELLKEAGMEQIKAEKFLCGYGKQAKAGLEQSSIEAIGRTIAPLSAVAKQVPTSFSERQLATLEQRLRAELESEGGAFEMVVAWGRRPRPKYVEVVVAEDEQCHALPHTATAMAP
jgi:pseurotin biosynthesis methyltransferase